jgi:hypothetical protein
VVEEEEEEEEQEGLRFLTGGDTGGVSVLSLVILPAVGHSGRNTLSLILYPAHSVHDKFLSIAN